VKVAVVDDEPLARKEMRRLLAAFSDVTIVAEAANVAEAHTLIETSGPDVVFLDIEMPDGTGFDLLARLDRVPLVIFTTAYDHHAIQAFEVDALDYLLKPVEPERLAAALARIPRRITPDDARLASPNNADPVERLFVRDGEHCWFVPVRDVRLFAAEGNYIRLYWDKVQPLLLRSLVQLEPRLDARQFFRANRGQIINLDFVQSVEPGLGGRLHVQLRGGPEVAVSRRQARLFRATG
jgi:two-component system LytT family response regulator